MTPVAIGAVFIVFAAENAVFEGVDLVGGVWEGEGEEGAFGAGEGVELG